MGAGGCNAPGHPTLLCNLGDQALEPETATIVDFVRAGARAGAAARVPDSGPAGPCDAQIEGEPLLFRTLLAIPSQRRQTAAARTLADAMLTTVRGRRAATS